MYEKFYGLSQCPFDITPDPRFFFGTPGHNEALASLYYGIERRKGFIVVSGEVGTGKTLLSRCLFLSLQAQQISFSYIFNPLLTVQDFLVNAIADLGLPVASKGKGEVLSDLNKFLISKHQQNSTAALIVDEAHLLSWELLEEIRLLTNLETARQKLLQIVLFGQPELEERLDSVDLRQLKQRVALRCRLEPMTEAETRNYIRARLFRAGANAKSETILPADTVGLIHRFSRGIPRLVNTISENCLIAGFAHRMTSIPPSIVEEVASDFCLSDSLETTEVRKLNCEALKQPEALLNGGAR
jgi:general secretion pathway protein A